MAGNLSDIGKQAEAKIKQWLPVVGYEGIYEVSLDGYVRSIPRVCRSKFGSERSVPQSLLKIHEFDSGYCYVVLSRSGRSKNVLLHRIVAEAFIPNPENKPAVNHIDLNKRNNCVSNLEWVTNSENTNHSIARGTIKISSQDHMKRMGIIRGKQLSKPIRCIETGREYVSIKQCAESMNIKTSYLYEYVSGNIKSCHGYHFELIGR